MLYQGDQKRIYVFCGDQNHGQVIPSGRYPTEQQTIYFPDTWTEGQDPGGGSAPVAGLYYPGRGFGKIWRENPDGVQRCLGYALTAAETGYTISVQQFERGLLLTDSVGRIYVVSLRFGKCCGLGGFYTRYEALRR